MSVMSAYEKMFKDGTAAKPIRIAQPTPDNPSGGMGVQSDPMKTALGEVKEDNSWKEFDSRMEQYIEEKRTKKPKTKTKTKKSSNESDTIKKLKSRVALLEGVVEQIMKTQMELMKNG